MNLEPLRRLQSKLSVAFVAAAALFLTSCGGGGATSSPTVGSLQLLPGTGSLYAGVPYTFNIVGGRKPYLVTASEPTLLELGYTVDGNTFTVVPRNPGVVDPATDPNIVPSRTVNIEVRDSNGASTTNAFNVLQNFFTGYRESYQSTCGTVGTGDPPQACSGTDTLAFIFPVSNGTIYGNREFQFDKVRGDYQFVVEDPAVVPQLVDRIRVRTDHQGSAFVRMRVTSAAPTQLATYKVTDIATGATMDLVVLIVQQAVVDAISLMPNELTFTGGLSTSCGHGTADVFVFGGTPPYTVTGSGGAAVSPTTVATSGGKFAVTVGVGVPPCPANASVVVTDSRGAIATVTVTVNPGSGSPTPLAAAPTTVDTLTCGASTAITVIGGGGSLSATSQHPRIRATLTGNTLTLTRLAGDPAGPYPTSGTVTVTDGSTIATITITATDASCL